MPIPIFQSTLPTRGSDKHKLRGISFTTNFNPRSPRGGATVAEQDAKTAMEISIHAPHEGERLSCWLGKTIRRYFNPRSPRGGATFAPRKMMLNMGYFNPRSPRGGATVCMLQNAFDIQISIHAPHEGERQDAVLLHVDDFVISIHAPHEGERRGCALLRNIYDHFNPRSPRGGATNLNITLQVLIGISIHAPHEGERHHHHTAVSSASQFQSTLPTRGSDSGKVHLYAAFPRIC